MSTAKRPTKLMEPTPSMLWTDHGEMSRRSKIAVGIVAVTVHAVLFTVILVIALNGRPA